MQTKPKTVRQLLWQLPVSADIRKAAIKHCTAKKGVVYDYIRTPSMALHESFLWIDSPEGYDFWENIYHSL